MKLHVDVHGDGTRPYLLLVHGFLSSRAQWIPNIAALSAVATPVSVELLGHGRSEAPVDRDAYRVARYVEAFEELRAALGAERWLLCGQSFGAGLTIRYALEHPERVVAQVFTNSVSGLSTRAEGTAEQRERNANAIIAGGRAAIERFPIYPRGSARWPKEINEALVNDGKRISPLAVAEAIRTTIPDLSVSGDLGRIAVPTLLVNGVRDERFQPMRDLAAREIKGLNVVDLDGGHSINLDCPDEFNQAVTNFIRTAR